VGIVRVTVKMRCQAERRAAIHQRLARENPERRLDDRRIRKLAKVSLSNGERARVGLHGLSSNNRFAPTTYLNQPDSNLHHTLA
jgi:hypothetical protein